MTDANGVTKACSPLILLMACVMFLPGLPLKFTLQQSALGLLGAVSLILAVYGFIKLFSREHRERSAFLSVECILIVFVLYVFVQLLPLEKNLIATISPAMADVWTIPAYRLTGKATLTADISGSLWFLITWLGYIILFVLVLRLSVKHWHFFIIAMAIYMLGICQILFDEVTKYLGYQYIEATQTDGHTYRMTGTFVNSNNLSALINLSIASGLTLLVYLVHQLKHKSLTVLVLPVALIGAGELLLFYGCIKSGSAGGLLSLILAIMLVCVVLFLRSFSLKLLAALIVFLLAVGIVLTYFGSRELNITELTQNLSLRERPLLWMDILRMWRDFALFGIGGGAFEWTFPLYKSDQVTPLRVATAHSGYLHLLVELGIIGMSIVLVFAGICLTKILARLFKPGLEAYLTGTLLVGVLAFLIQEVVETNLLIPAVAVPFFGLLALTLKLSLKPDRT